MSSIGCPEHSTLGDAKSSSKALGRVLNEKIDNHEIVPLLFQPIGHNKVFFYVPIKLISFSIRRESRLFYAGNREKLRALRMKHGFLPILGIYSPGLYLIKTHSRNKSICYCGFGTELLCRKSAENHVFLDSEQPSNQQKESPQTLNFLFVMAHIYNIVQSNCLQPAVKK